MQIKSYFTLISVNFMPKQNNGTTSDNNWLRQNTTLSLEMSESSVKGKEIFPFPLCFRNITFQGAS